MYCKIMLVEDDSIILDDILTMIDWEKRKYIIKTAVNGEKGLALFKSFRPDIVITDVRMPYMTGLEMIEEINKVNAEVPIVVLSAYDDFEYARGAVKLGVRDYILKTEIDEDILLSKIEELRTLINKPSSENDFSPIINKAAEYISENFKNCELKIEDIAKHIHMSVSRLSVRFHEETGKTIKEYITLMRIAHAKKLLLSGEYKVYEVAELSGYSNSTYFSNLFREHTGISPAKYYSGV